MKKAVLYIHGKGGSASESEHYKRLFDVCTSALYGYEV